jgi:hypothetical protein
VCQLARENLNPFIVSFVCRIVFLLQISSRVSFPKHNLLMVVAGVVDLDTGAMIEKQGRGRPCGSKNKTKDASLVASSSSASISGASAAPWEVRTSSSHPSLLPKVQALLLAMPLLLLLLSKPSPSSLSLVLNAVSSSVFL